MFDEQVSSGGADLLEDVPKEFSSHKSNFGDLVLGPEWDLDLSLSIFLVIFL